MKGEHVLVSISRFEEQGVDLEEGIRHVLEEVVPSIQGRTAFGPRTGRWIERAASASPCSSGRALMRLAARCPPRLRQPRNAGPQRAE